MNTNCPCGRPSATQTEHPAASDACQCVACYDFHLYAAMRHYTKTPSEILAEQTEVRFIPIAVLQAGGAK